MPEKLLGLEKNVNSYYIGTVIINVFYGEIIYMTDYKNSNGVTYGLTYHSGILGIGANYDLKVTYTDGSTYSITGISTNNVLTSINGTLNILSLLGLGGGAYVIPPGYSGKISTVLSALTGTTVHVGGTAVISTGASLLSGMTVNVDGGAVTLASGLLGNALSGTTINLRAGGSFGNGLGLLSALSGSTINFGQGGGVFIANAGGTLINLSGMTINGFDAARDIVRFTNLAGNPDAYTIVSRNGSQIITALDEVGSTLATFTVSGTSFATGKFSVSGRGPLTMSKNGGTLSVEALASICFLAGTMIRTPDDECPVEMLQDGDEVIVVIDGELGIRKIIWAGSRHTTTRAEKPIDEAGFPIRIRKDAFGDAMPYQDLLITSEHCLYIDGKFIPARMLINGGSIFYDSTIKNFRYYHIETEDHSVVFASGLQTESYLDTGNRSAFTSVRQSDDYHILRRNLRPVASVCVDRSFVEPIHKWCKERAVDLGYLSDDYNQALEADPHIRLVAGINTIIRPHRYSAGMVSFYLPPNLRTVWIESSASKPSDTIGPFVDDRRYLGVLIGRVILFEADAAQEIQSHLVDRQMTGWHDIERQGTRWTDGRALLELPDRNGHSFGILCFEILASGPYLVEPIYLPACELGMDPDEQTGRVSRSSGT